MFTDKKEYTIKKIIALWTQYMALWNQFIKLDLMVMLLIISNIFLLLYAFNHSHDDLANYRHVHWDYADDYHDHDYADDNHDHDYADDYHDHDYADDNHDHDHHHWEYAPVFHDH